MTRSGLTFLLILGAALFIFSCKQKAIGLNIFKLARNQWHLKYLFWENTKRKELHPIGLTSKVTTEFAYNGTSRGLHKERYCRIDVSSKLKCM